MAKFFADENFPLPVVLALRELQHDVLTIQEAGRAGQSLPDDAVLAFAHVEGRALLTINRKHFIRLHLDGQTHSGIVACTLDVDFDAFARRIHDAVQEQDLLVGQLIRVNRSRQ
jgi:hypothetical protein